MIRTTDLQVCYGGVPAIDSVTAEFPRGAITAIVGPSGCGKSTFLSALNRMTDLISNATVRCEIQFDWVSVFGPKSSPTELRKCVGMIFQKPNPFPMSIRKNIQLGLREHGLRDRGQLEAETESALKDVGLWEEVKDRLDANALRLSGGQQQRLCIARALALKPKVLLMDEPCSALDPIAAAKVEDLIVRLRGDYTVAIVTHNLAQAKRISDFMMVFWIRDGVGKIIEQGRTNRLFEKADDETVKAYLSGGRG